MSVAKPLVMKFSPLLPQLRLRFVPRPSMEAEFVKGYMGPPGPPGGGTYMHTQTTPAAVWTAAHNLGRYPSVSIVDHLGNLMLADVRFVDADTVQIAHAAPTIGKVYFN